METTEKTYAETLGNAPFDWIAFLTGPAPTPAQWSHALNLSEYFVTCACANQCASLPRWPDGEPKDEQLAALGYQFNTCIANKYTAAALEILAAIEARSAYLLTELEEGGEPC